MDYQKEKIVSFLLPTQILETIDDIRYQEGQSSRSSVIRKLVNSGLKNYYRYLENDDLVTRR
jgi:metal-responsive CopG/Arc/MetJ family transcriptional regulator